MEIVEERREPNVGWTEALGEHAGNPKEPRSGGGCLFALGKQWTVASDEARIKAQFEQAVRARALQACFNEPNEERQRRMLSAYLGDLGGGAYNWDGAHCRKATEDLPGMHLLLYLLLRRCHQEVTEQDVAWMFDDSTTACAESIRWALGNLKSLEDERKKARIAELRGKKVAG